jgi:tRNA threonylcarbamoyladenosine biosynthesis protein TsaB
MLILGIETSGHRGSIAVCDGANGLAEVELESIGRRHAQTLVSQIDATLGRLQSHPRDLQAVAVSIGPGSFTGLRVGVTCAKTLAYATGCHLSAVDTLAAIAANSPGDVEVVSVVSDAQRGELFVGTYRRQPDGSWVSADNSTDAPVTIVSAESWLGSRAVGETFSGPGLQKYRPLVRQDCRILPENLWTPRARVVAEIGLRKIERGELADPEQLEPFYLRRSAAEERYG